MVDEHLPDFVDELLDRAVSSGAALARAGDGTPILNLPASLDPDLKKLLRRHQHEIAVRIAERIAERRSQQIKPEPQPAPTDRSAPVSVPRRTNTGTGSGRKATQPANRKPVRRSEPGQQTARRRPAPPKPTVFDIVLTGLIYAGLPLAALAYATLFIIR